MSGAHHARRLAVLASIVLAALAASGCVERKEKIAIEDDGTVRMHLEFATGSFDELYSGDAIPTIEGGWLVEESVDRDDDGEETFRLVADAVYLPDQGLPESYAPGRGEEVDVSLNFPTTLEIEPRRDGVYYHFARTYDARPWAYLDKPRSMLKTRLEEMEGREFEDLSGPERAALVRFVAKFETMKYRVFARTAFREALTGAPQDLWLAVHGALAESAETLDVERMLELIVDEDDELSDEALEAEMEAFQETAIEAMQQALRRGGQSGGGGDFGAVNAFVRRFRRHMRYYEITEELGDDKFTIEVTMPGEIVGHNGDSLDGATVEWEFNGEMLRDRALELMVTSRVVDE